MNSYCKLIIINLLSARVIPVTYNLNQNESQSARAESARKRVNQRLKYVTQTEQQQRPESRTVTLTWHVNKYQGQCSYHWLIIHTERLKLFFFFFFFFFFCESRNVVSLRQQNITVYSAKLCSLLIGTNTFCLPFSATSQHRAASLGLRRLSGSFREFPGFLFAWAKTCNYCRKKTTICSSLPET